MASSSTSPASRAGYFTGAKHTVINNSPMTDVGRDMISVQNNHYHGAVPLAANDPLASLNPVEVDPYPHTCMPNTRKSILDEIYSWLDNGEPGTRNIYILSGSPGSGKSTIAATVVAELGRRKRLCANFRFKHPEVSDASRAWSTVAFQLACSDESFKSALLDVLAPKPKISAISWQFEELVKGPLVTATGGSRLLPVVVIDALDECRGDTYQDFYKTLSRWSELSPGCKLLITARAEAVHSPMTICAIHTTLHTGSLTTAESQEDIKHYLFEKLHDYGQQFEHLKTGWPEPEKVEILVDYAAGLFIWAATAVRFIIDEDISMPKQQLDAVLSGNLKKGDIESLYMAIFTRAFEKASGETIQTLQAVLGVIFTAKRSLYYSSVKHFLPSTVSEDRIISILQKLKSVLLHIDGYIYVCHLSLIEVLCNLQAASKFSIILQKYTMPMVLSCFNVMNKKLKFNICEIETSYLPNDAISDLPGKIEKFVPDHLSYACCYWGQHMEEMIVNGKNKNMQNQIQIFLQKHFLHWLEILSILHQFQFVRITQDITCISKWALTVKKDLYKLSVDMTQFVNMFSEPMALSAPHVYLSAMTWCPENSLTLKHYTLYIKPGIIVHTGKDTHWPATLSIMTGHRNTVTSIAFSPDGTRVVSGSNDYTVRIWNAQTGHAVGAPFIGHTNRVTSVAFSPDGTRVVSGSYDHTVRIWNAQTGHAVGAPFIGHTNRVTSVAFSPDGTRVVSGSYDHTVRIWNAQTGHAVGAPFIGHTNRVTSVAFSPDGTRVVSGSYDQTVRIWNANHGRSMVTLYTPFIKTSSPSSSNIEKPRTLFDGIFDKSTGWIKSIDGEHLLLWVPKHQRGILSGWELLEICGGSATKLDFNNFAYGPFWTECNIEDINSNAEDNSGSRQKNKKPFGRFLGKRSHR